MKCRILLNFSIIFAFMEIVLAATDKIVCYHGSWSYYRSGNGKFTVNDIDSTLCTHLIYTFVGLEENGNVKLLDSYLESDLGNLKSFNALKDTNPNLKTLLAIGGWNEGSETYSNVVADAGKRAVFIQSALALVQTYNFNGFDLDWEYPALRGGSASDKENFATLIKEFRTEWDKYGLLLTAAVRATSIDDSYDVPALSEYLDIINVMTYDFHGSYDEVTGENAPLYASSIEVTDDAKTLNVASAIIGWIEKGANPQKIALGLGSYGRTYTLSSSSNNKVGAPISGAGNSGKYTQESGFLGYNEICELQLEGGWTVVWNDEQKTPYAYKDTQWVGYDNPESLKIKVEFAKSLNLAGVMLWSVETDDFKGICGSKYPLLNAINTAIAGSSDVNQSSSKASSSSTSSSSTTSTTTTTTTTTTEKSTSTELCVESGYVRDPDDCSVFYYCFLVRNQFIPVRQNCNSGLLFDPEKVICNYANLVDC